MAANTAYNAQPLQESFVDDIKYWNEDRAARREEARVDGAIEERRKNKKQEDKNALFSLVSDQNKIWDSGNTSYNDAISRGIELAKTQYSPLLAIIDPDNTRATLAEKQNARNKVDNLNNFADNLKKMSLGQEQQWAAASKLIEDDAVFDNPEQRKMQQGLYKNFQIGYDKNMNPVFTFVDFDGDGENDNLGTQTIESTLNNEPIFNYYKKHDEVALAREMAKDIGTEQTKTNSGLTSTEKLNFKKEAIKTRVNSLLYKPDGKLSTVSMSMLKKANKDPENPSKIDVTEIETEFTKLVNSFDKTKNLEEVKRFAPTTEGNNPTSFGERVKASKQTWGEEFFDQIAVGSGSVPVSNVKMSAITGEKGETASNAEINNYTYHKDGSILLSLSVPKTTRHTTKEYDELILNADESLKEQLARMAQKGNDGYVTITYPGQNTKQVIKGSSDDEGNLANAKGISIEELRKRAGYNGKKDNSPVVGPKTESNGVGSKYN